MEFIFHAHSGLRYLVLLAGVLTLGYALYGWLTKRAWDRAARILGSSFAGLLDLQVLLGIVLVFRIYYPALIGHIVMMALAAVVVHGASVANRRAPHPRFGLLAAATALALVMIVGGIMAIQRPIL
jgi:hypothetical protein